MREDFMGVTQARMFQAGAGEEAQWQYLRQHLDRSRIPSLAFESSLPVRRLKAWGGKISAWWAQRLRQSDGVPARLVALTRLTLGPRQALTLIEVDGVRILVGTSADASPTFLQLSSDQHSPKVENALLDVRPNDPAQAPAMKTDAVGRQGSMPSKTRHASMRSSWDGSLTQNVLMDERALPSMPSRLAAVSGTSATSPPPPIATWIAHVADPPHAVKNPRNRNRAARRTSAPGRVSW